MRTLWLALIALVVLVVLTFSSYNGLVNEQETVKQAWSQVENVYQRRIDLIPNLVATVKGYAAHEHQVFVEVTQARAQAAGTLNANAMSDPEKLKQMDQSQAALSSALSRLLVVVERYPDLKANQNFLSLQAQLEGTENRIAVERKRFNEAALTYNTHLRQFPTMLVGRLFGFTQTPYFQSQPGADKAPEVKF